MTREGIRFGTMNRTLNGEEGEAGARLISSTVTMDEGVEHSVKWFLENEKNDKKHD